MSSVPIGTDSGRADSRRRPKRSPKAHAQVPVDLVRSRDHSDLAVLVWTAYEGLMRDGIGGRVPACPKRATLAGWYGLSPKTIDVARRQLLADRDGGAWLGRSAPQGAKRSVRHVALRRPQETGARYVRVPQWTRDRVWADRRGRRQGEISPGAWRFYASLTHFSRGRAVDVTAQRLGALVGASGATGARRLRELEAAGMVAVTARPGDRATVRVVVDEEEARRVAARYAEGGREMGRPRQESPRIVAVGLCNERQSPPASASTPQDAPGSCASGGDAKGAPAVGEDLQVQGGPRCPADAGSKARSSSRGGGGSRRSQGPRASGERIRDAAAVYRTLPAKLRERIPQGGSGRVVAAIAAELQHRSVAELRERVLWRWEWWRYKPATEPVEDPTAVAMTLVRRGYHCPDVRCEAGMQLDTGSPCAACAEGARGAPSAEDGPGGTRVPPSLDEARSEALRGGSMVPDPEAGKRGGDLARRLMAARTEAERAAIWAEAEGSGERSGEHPGGAP